MINLLLDTHALIWWLLNSKRLGKTARSAILQPSAELFISAASVWEMSIKFGTGRLQLPEPPEKSVADLLDNGFRPLPIHFQHAIAIRKLPPHHNDPFDRMLIAQAQCEGLTLVTADPAIAAYDVRTLDASQ
jgi:PIN domain nuclease of toxin-antitoxin system